MTSRIVSVRRSLSPGRGLVLGAVAGAAGTTALNLVTYLDMTVRGRGTSDTPEKTVEALADAVDVQIPGDDDTRQNRISGLGPITGIAAGVGVGALLGLVRGLGWRPPVLLGALVVGAAAVLASDGSMAALGVSDPRHWSGQDWLVDGVPHLAYGVVTAAALNAFDH